MLIKKYQPTLLWNINNGSHGSCLPSQNSLSGWTVDFWKHSQFFNGHHELLAVGKAISAVGDKITWWAPMLGKRCQSNSSLKQVPRLWAVWVGSNRNRSPTGTMRVFFSPLFAWINQSWMAFWKPKHKTGIWWCSQVKFPALGAKGNHFRNSLLSCYATSQSVHPWRKKPQTIIY